MDLVVIAFRRALTVSGLCLAAAISLPGCAAERTSRPAFGWVRNLLPFRSNQIAERDSVEAADERPYQGSQGDWAPSDSPDSYYSPRAKEYAQPQRATPPLAPPAVEPGFFAEESDNATQSTSGRLRQNDRPALLKDVLESWGRKPSTERRPTIPLDEPVAELHGESVVRVVDFERREPIALGEPVFDAAE